MNPEPLTPEEHRLLDEFISELVGVHFPDEKATLLEMRLRPRLQELRLRRYLDYYLLLLDNPGDELTELTHLVTNNETYFFRETRQFEALFEELLPALGETPASAGTLRVLCAGCSSGEEPYTLNIYRQLHPVQAAGVRLEIDAFDIDAERLETARRAEYGPNSLRATSEEQIHSYFTRTGSHRFRLLPRFQNGVRFARGNILERGTYPGLRQWDVVFCRNVLIYFSESAVRRAVANFATALRPGGVLFLGHAESLIGVSPAFDTIRLQRSIAYRRTAT